MSLFRLLTLTAGFSAALFQPLHGQFLSVNTAVSMALALGLACAAGWELTLASTAR